MLHESEAFICKVEILIYFHASTAGKNSLCYIWLFFTRQFAKFIKHC